MVDMARSWKIGHTSEVAAKIMSVSSATGSHHPMKSAALAAVSEIVRGMQEVNPMVLAILAQW
jgi:hypothetical protein